MALLGCPSLLHLVVPSLLSTAHLFSYHLMGRQGQLSLPMPFVAAPLTALLGKEEAPGSLFPRNRDLAPPITPWVSAFLQGKVDLLRM